MATKTYTASRGRKKRFNLPAADAREYGSHGWKISSSKRKKAK